MVPTSELHVVLELPYGRGCDHAEGMTLLAERGRARLLVEFDMFPADTDFEHTNPACTLLAAELERLGAL